MICQEPMDNDLTSCFREGVYSESDIGISFIVVNKNKRPPSFGGRLLKTESLMTINFRKLCAL
jgi:hypothetical protein